MTTTINCRIKKTNVQLCNCVVSRGFISTTNDKMQKKAKCFFVSVVDRRQNDCRRGFAIVQVGPFRIKKTKVSTMGPKLAPKRDAKLDAARRNRCNRFCL